MRKSLATFIRGAALGAVLAIGSAPVVQAQTAPDTTTTTTTARDDDDGGDYGWIGLVGLAGLAGLMRRDRAGHSSYQTAPSRP